MLHLTGWLQQHAPPQQLGQDFLPSRSEDGGHRWNGDSTVAWIAQQIAQRRHAALLALHRSSSCVRGEGWQPVADGRGRTAARVGCVVFVGHTHASRN